MPNNFARSLRNNATPAERILWQQLKLLKAEGRHFRRQVQIEKFIADFACHYPKVVVELDGGQHSDTVRYDESRTQILKQHGYHVLRFWNADVFEALEGVIDRIRNAVRLPTLYSYCHFEFRSTPTPNPPRKGEGVKRNHGRIHTSTKL